MILKGDLIEYFVGELISHTEADKRTSDKKGGYILYLDQSYCLDCYKTCINGDCLASKSNNHLGLIHEFTGEKAIQNAKLITRIIIQPEDLADPLDIIPERRIYVAYLRASRDIPTDQEICYPYGRSYTQYDDSI
jgi:hypothetical protein